MDNKFEAKEHFVWLLWNGVATCAEFEKSKMLSSMKSANREFQAYTPIVHLQRWSVLSFQNKELLSATYALVPPFLWGAHCPCGDNHRFYHYHLLLIYIFINYIADKKEWSGVPVPHPQQIGRLPELSDVLCPQCKSCRAFDKLICFEQYSMRLNRTKMIFMYTMCTTHTCDQLSKKCCVNSKEKLNKFHWTVEECTSD